MEHLKTSMLSEDFCFCESSLGTLLRKPGVGKTLFLIGWVGSGSLDFLSGGMSLVFHSLLDAEVVCMRVCKNVNYNQLCNNSI